MLVKTRVIERLLRLIALLWFLVWVILPIIKPPKSAQEVGGLVAYILLVVLYFLIWLGGTILLCVYAELMRQKRLGKRG